MFFSQLPRPLITVRQLAHWIERVRHYPGPELVVLDASWSLAADKPPHKSYLAKNIGTLLGAQFFDIDAITAPSTLPHMLPSPQLFAESVGKLGINNDSHVVIYDNKGLFSAPRAWFTFRVFGHDNVSILDGGLPAWLSDATVKTESGEPPKVKPQVFYPDYRADLVVNIDQVKQQLLHKQKAASFSRQVVDARSAARFMGTAPEPRKGLPSGHMPNAINVPYSSVFHPDSEKVVDAEALKGAFTKSGVKYDQPFIASCGSGITACHIILGAYILGNERVALYDGSWTEWASRPDSPIETDLPKSLRF